MLSATFGFDYVASLFLLVFIATLIFFWNWSRSYQKPQILFSNLASFQIKPASLCQRLSELPHYLLIAAFILFGLAFTDPYFLIKKTDQPPPLKQMNIPTEGLAIYLILDQSGSMNEAIQGQSRKKIDIMKQFTQAFIKGDSALGLKGRLNDMIGVVAFARGVQILSPLTLDHEQVLEQLGKLDGVKREDQDGTSIGYAIFKTANLISATRHFAENLEGSATPAYEIKSAIMILVTDGFQSPSPLDQGKELRNIDLKEAAEYAKEQNIKLYIVNVEPRLASNEEFAPFRKAMQQTAEITGGKFYTTESSSTLGKIYADIDRLEKSPFFEAGYIMLPSQMLQYYDRISFYPYLVAVGMFCFLVSILLSGTILRKIP